jgi:hypothetical protein
MALPHLAILRLPKGAGLLPTGGQPIGQGVAIAPALAANAPKLHKTQGIERSQPQRLFIGAFAGNAQLLEPLKQPPAIATPLGRNQILKTSGP